MDPSSLFAPFNTDVQSIKAFGLERGVALAGATFCGALLGYERELRGSPAGMKTCTLVCIGATMYMHVGHQLASTAGAGTTDPTLMASQIVTGVGFLGAGTIMSRDRGVTGLTSAATIWFIGAVGLVNGCGLPLSAITLTVTTVAILRGLARVEARIFPIRGGKSSDDG